MSKIEKNELADNSVLSPHPSFVEVSDELLSRGNSMRFRADGKSMHPTIQEGEKITVEPVAPSDVKVGDIILYRFDRGVIAHRVVSIENANNSALSPHHLFLLHGDASDTCDEPVELGQILGKVVSVERDGRIINLDCRRARLLHKARVYASRLRKAITSPQPNPLPKGARRLKAFAINRSLPRTTAGEG